ncbi:LytTR family transcriptional regulator DNA-binding domain-containing protein [Pseudomonas aeruginosa]|nr:LytTR family DNA-binding domain-containing protein [Pseudomonas aeruginosa]
MSTSTRQSYGRRQHENRAQSHLRQALQGNSVSQITHFVAEDKYVIAYYPDGVLVLNETLKALETEFADEFIRAHRKALVRRSLISMFKTRPDDSQAGELLLLGTENWIPVSRSHSAQIKSAMGA